jgi:hypothetical protein
MHCGLPKGAGEFGTRLPITYVSTGTAPSPRIQAEKSCEPRDLYEDRPQCVAVPQYSFVFNVLRPAKPLFCRVVPFLMDAFRSSSPLMD